MVNKDRFTAEQIIDAIQRSKGMITVAAQMLRCKPQTVRNYMGRYPTIETVLREERERMTDIAELALYKAIQDGEAWAVSLYLKTQGKGRGYVERQELTGPNGAPIEMTVREVIVRLNDQPL